MTHTYSELEEHKISVMWPNHSAAIIARRLGHGISRNAIIGKANRLSLPPKRTGVRPQFYIKQRRKARVK